MKQTKEVLNNKSTVEFFFLTKSQYGYRTELSTTDIIFSVRQLQEKCNEQNMPLYIVFIELIKDFDKVSRKGLFAILFKISCPLSLFSIIKSFHTKTKATVQYYSYISDSIMIKSLIHL